MKISRWKTIFLPLLFLLFFICLFAQMITGFHVFNEEIAKHHGDPFTLSQYLLSGHFMEATFENWESDFLQICLFIWLFGSIDQTDHSESIKMDEDPNAGNKPVIKSNVFRLFSYQHYYSIFFFFMFLLFFGFHFFGSLINYNNDQILNGKPVVNAAQYVGNNRFWFESFQNWQSKFLSLWCAVILIIPLRKKSKKTNGFSNL